ncbi:Uncharacterised protein [uncultured archaeon]|nr:Uncharacterised protein [uncultured archaeon]
MKNKTQALFAGSVLALVFLLTFASAASFSVSQTSISFTPSVTAQAFTITLNNQSETKNFTLSPMAITGENGYVAVFSHSGSLENISTSTITITPTAAIDYTKFSFGKTYTSTFLVSNAQNVSDNQTISLKVDNTQFCSYGNTLGSNFQISDLSFNNEGKFGDDDVWYPLTEVKVELTVENNADYDVQDAEIRWALYSNTGKLIMDGKESKVDVDSDDEQTVSFTIKLDENLDDLNDGTYTFYVKATGKADLDTGSETVCTEDSDSVEVVVENDFVILDNLEYQNDTSCGSDLQITADAFNIGSDKQTDVYVRVHNSELGINQNVQLGDIKSMDSELFSFLYTIPSNITAKTYAIQLDVYDDGDDIYKNNDDEEATYVVPVSVSGCAPSITGIVSGGDVQSGGNAGKDLVVKVSVTNTGKALTTYTVNPTSYSDWASSVTLDQSTIVVSPGQSKDILLTFKTKTVETGEYNFNVELAASGKTIATQPFQVSLDNSSWFGDFNGFGDNWYLWVIGALNVILVLIIIIVAVRVARR